MLCNRTLTDFKYISIDILSDRNICKDVKGVQMSRYFQDVKLKNKYIIVGSKVKI